MAAMDLAHDEVAGAELAGANSILTVQESLWRWEDRPHLDPDDAASWEQDLANMRKTVTMPEHCAWDYDWQPDSLAETRMNSIQKQ